MSELPGKLERAWNGIAVSMGSMTKQQLHKIVRLGRRELEARHQADKALYEWKLNGYRAMANFMAGVTWALACRWSLRDSKDHHPFAGVRPQSGEMWLPRELLTAVRHQVKARGWHPITSVTAADVLNNLAAEASRHPVRADSSLTCVQFVVPMVRSEARVLVDDRFDRSDYRDAEPGRS